MIKFFRPNPCDYPQQAENNTACQYKVARPENTENVDTFINYNEKI
jgi:t-SNARE complex subunit (syntaxin)